LNNVIWKYPLLVTDEQLVTMPEYSIPLFVEKQNETLCIWVKVDPTQKSIEQTIRVYGTGHPMSVNHERHVGSVIDGEYVWHVFWVYND